MLKKLLMFLTPLILIPAVFLVLNHRRAASQKRGPLEPASDWQQMQRDIRKRKPLGPPVPACIQRFDDGAWQFMECPK